MFKPRFFPHFPLLINKRDLPSSPCGVRFFSSGNAGLFPLLIFRIHRTRFTAPKFSCGLTPSPFFLILPLESFSLSKGPFSADFLSARSPPILRFNLHGKNHVTYYRFRSVIPLPSASPVIFPSGLVSFMMTYPCLPVLPLTY